MSYEVLARKWRPANFTELVGQEHVQRALVNALDEDRLHHAYLFTGTRGVGKTTIARIFAKSLNCETGVTSKPCGQCGACTEIAEGRFIDLVEVDAASRTGVDDTRELLENVQYAPSRGRYKVYLIDEVHMFSKSSFNALLKTLEEPPPHVKFLLATTEPQKLPVTILSRCLQFNLKRLSPGLIIGQLQHILDSENVQFDLAALQLLAEAADGSMRDGLSLLDQGLAFGAGEIRETEMRGMLGSVSRDGVMKIFKALLGRNANTVLTEINALAELTPDYESVLVDLTSLLHHMALAKTVPEALDEYVSHHEELLALSEQISVEDIQLFYQIALIGRRDLPLCPDAKSGFEMLMLRMLTFRPVVNSNDVHPKGTSFGAHGRTNTAVAGSSAVNSSVNVASVTSSVKQNSVAATVNNSNAIAESASQPPVENVKAQIADGVKEPVKKYDGVLDWRHIIEQLAISGMVKQMAANCVLKEKNESAILLTLGSGFKQLLNAKAKTRLKHALSEYFDEDIHVDIVVEAVSDDRVETPAQEVQREKDSRQQQAESAVENDGFVQSLKNNFNAEVVPGSVQPVTEDN